MFTRHRQTAPLCLTLMGFSGSTMKPHFIEAEVNVREASEWLAWIEDNLLTQPLSPPRPDARQLVVINALARASQIKRMLRGHLPETLRRTFIEGVIVHECWKNSIHSKRPLTTCVDPY